ncbi:hypothetical protein [Kitasatospora phosalacinea]|uniref:Uncharacterized protein n=1 Tax=Kitasatospora phosalacinea TaxID=2065 RepID=A0A9W6PQ20_9ACTN|nr:hypothetical protein [Kitasatospora phosalacinea]GLW58898.1 hypothetical protein Kpho01_69080 [Kitasatospora phosalacinea]
MADERRERGQTVASLGSSLRSGRNSLGTVPKLLEDLLVTGGWKDFVTQLGDHVTYTDTEFETFVQTLPLKGLGATLDLVELIIGDRTDLLVEFHRLTPRLRTGRPGKVPDIVRDFPDAGPDGGDQAIVAAPAPRRPAAHGNSREGAIRRLERERPDLLAQVKAGELTPHRASVLAGWRKEMLTIPRSNPEEIAQALVKKLDAADAAEVKAALERLLSPGSNGSDPAAQKTAAG